MAVALYPGSFDPLHNGHLAIIETAASIFEKVIVSVGHNPEKPSGYFDVEERMAIIEGTTGGLANVSVSSFTGLVTDAVADQRADCLLKGVRSNTDVDAEMLQAKMNAATGNDVPTVFLPGIGSNSLVSSRYIREIAGAGGDVSSVVPQSVLDQLKNKAGR